MCDYICRLFGGNTFDHMFPFKSSLYSCTIQNISEIQYLKRNDLKPGLWTGI